MKTPMTEKKTWKYKTGDSVRGERNPCWKGDKATTSSLHCWIRDNFQKPDACELCGNKEANLYDWSNKDHKYRRVREDWQYSCRKCHIAYDIQFNGRPKPYSKRQGAWAQKYDHCIDCGKTEAPHDGKGLCRRCSRRVKPKSNVAI
jgi:hypothetical protein